LAKLQQVQKRNLGPLANSFINQGVRDQSLSCFARRREAGIAQLGWHEKFKLIMNDGIESKRHWAKPAPRAEQAVYAHSVGHTVQAPDLFEKMDQEDILSGD
jgi:hypothetical protein